MTVSVVNVNVFVATHACGVVNAADQSKLPTVSASHAEMWDSVSFVPPFVQTGAVPVNAIALPDGAAKATVTRVVEPAAAAVAPAAPGSAVCNLRKQPAGAVAFVLRNKLRMGVAMLALEIPTVMPRSASQGMP